MSQSGVINKSEYSAI